MSWAPGAAGLDQEPDDPTRLRRLDKNGERCPITAAAVRTQDRDLCVADDHNPRKVSDLERVDVRPAGGSRYRRIKDAWVSDDSDEIDGRPRPAGPLEVALRNPKCSLRSNGHRAGGDVYRLFNTDRVCGETRLHVSGKGDVTGSHGRRRHGQDDSSQRDKALHAC